MFFSQFNFYPILDPLKFRLSGLHFKGYILNLGSLVLFVRAYQVSLSSWFNYSTTLTR
jgi:hypothetical protein